jgi:hypothetical protein
MEIGFRSRLGRRACIAIDVDSQATYLTFWDVSAPDGESNKTTLANDEEDVTFCSTDDMRRMVGDGRKLTAAANMIFVKSLGWQWSIQNPSMVIVSCLSR